MSQNTIDVALSVLRKYDNNCLKIIDSCFKVKLYDYDKSKKDWVVKDDSEGAFCIVERNIPPLCKFFFLSKFIKHGDNLPVTDVALSHFLVYEANDAFCMFGNERGIVRAILFPTKTECDRLCTIINGLVNELKNESIKASDFSGLNNKSDISSPIVGGDKIYSMLESVRQKYEESVHVEKYSRQIDINELFKSTTSASHNSHPSALINSFSPLSIESKQSQTNLQVVDGFIKRETHNLNLFPRSDGRSLPPARRSHKTAAPALAPPPAI